MNSTQEKIADILSGLHDHFSMKSKMIVQTTGDSWVIKKKDWNEIVDMHIKELSKLFEEEDKIEGIRDTEYCLNCKKSVQPLHNGYCTCGEQLTNKVRFNPEAFEKRCRGEE